MRSCSRCVVPAVGGTGCGDVLRRASGGHGVPNGESAARCVCRWWHGFGDTRTIFKKLYVTAARNSFE